MKTQTVRQGTAERRVDLLKPEPFARLRARVSAFLLLAGALVGVLGWLTDPVQQVAASGPAVLAGVAVVALLAPLCWRYGDRAGESAFAVLWLLQICCTVLTGLRVDADARGMAVEMLLLGVTSVAAIFVRSTGVLLTVTATACLGAVVLVVNARRPLMLAQVIVSVTTLVIVTLIVRLLRTTAVGALLEARQVGETDHLTGLLNRHGLAEHAGPLWRRSALDGTSLAVALVDIDHFKAVNDTFGHGAGDDLLRHVADRLALHVPADGLLVRLGGEEFLLVVALAAGTHAVELAERAHLAVRHTWTQPVTVSVGVVEVWPQEDDELPEQLWHAVEAADGALYEAKGSGRDRIAVAHEAVSTPPFGQDLVVAAEPVEIDLRQAETAAATGRRPGRHAAQQAPAQVVVPPGVIPPGKSPPSARGANAGAPSAGPALTGRRRRRV